MFWIVILLFVIFGSAAVPIVLLYLAGKSIWKRLAGGSKKKDPPRLEEVRSRLPHSPTAPRGCPHAEAIQLGRMERRLKDAYRQYHDALDRRIPSELARSRVAPPLEDAYTQIGAQIASIYAFCERNDLTGTLRKARSSTTASDIYQEAFDRDITKVRAAIAKTEECLAAFERTVATLEVSSVDADLTSDFDASIEMLRALRDELPYYNLEDAI